MPLITKEMSPPFMYGDSQPEAVIVGWGSTYGVMKEAVDIKKRKEDCHATISAKFIRFREQSNSITLSLKKYGGNHLRRE